VVGEGGVEVDAVHAGGVGWVELRVPEGEVAEALRAAVLQEKAAGKFFHAVGAGVVRGFAAEVELALPGFCGQRV